MPTNAFTMYVQKRGRMKYLLLTVIPPMILMYVFSRFFYFCVELDSDVTSCILILLFIAIMLPLGYFLIIKKNHQIVVKDNQIIEIDWQQHEVCSVKVSQIHSIKCNFLNELILLDENGKRLLCVESNMYNFHKFEQWLEIHNIYQRR